MLQNATKKTPKNAEEYNCILCLYTCSKKSDFMRHTTTRKHKKAIQIEINATKKSPKIAELNKIKINSY